MFSTEMLSIGAEYAKEFEGPFRVWIASYPYVILNSAESVEVRLDLLSAQPLAAAQLHKLFD